MLSIDASSSIEFHFQSTSANPPKGSANFWFLDSLTCSEYSVGEFGGSIKQLSVKLPDNILSIGHGRYSFCVFSPRLNGVSGTDNLNYGSTSSSIGVIASSYLYSKQSKLSSSQITGYDSTVSFLISEPSFVQYSFAGSPIFSVSDLKAIFNRKVESTNNVSFYSNNCAAMTCQHCTVYSCTPISNDDVSSKCDVEDPKNTPNESDDNLMRMITTAIVAAMVTGLIAVIVISILIYCYCKKRSHEHSSSQGYSSVLLQDRELRKNKPVRNNPPTAPPEQLIFIG